MLCLCSFTPFVPFLFFFFPLPLRSSFYLHPDNYRLCLLSYLLSVTSFSWQFLITSSCLTLFFPPLPSHLFSIPSRGAGVICAPSVLSQRAASSGEGTLRTGFCPGCRAPICPPLWPSPCTYPTPAPPGRAGSRDTKVHKLNTALSSASPPHRRQ